MVKPVRRLLLLWRNFRNFFTLRSIVRFFTPQTGEIASRDFIFDQLSEKYPSAWQVLPRIPLQIIRAIRIRARETFCLRMTAGQMCIFLFFFLTVMTPPLFAALALTFFTLLIRETYVLPKERFAAEWVTGFMTAALMAVFNLALGAIFTKWMLPAEIVMPRIGVSAMAIALFRYNMAPETGPAHPFKGLLRLHESLWYLNDLWLVIAHAYLLTLDSAAPVKWQIQPFFTISPAMMLFVTAIRLQLNPIGGRYRHQMIQIVLLSDPYEDEIRMKRDYLLAGADWCKNFTLQSLLEILAFAFGSAPLMIALGQWYTGDPNAAHINWRQMAVNATAWIVLITTWPYLKKRNRQTRSVFDQTIRTFSSMAKNNCKVLAPSVVVSVEGQI